MRLFLASLPLLLVLVSGTAAFAEETQRTDLIVEKMSVKLVRGVTNVATAVAELPKQIYLTSKDRGTATGLIIGPLKGLGMTLYRGFTGIAETAFFMIPQPGYFDPMIDPDFVWKGWDDTHNDRNRLKEAEPAEPAGRKGE